jgi:magnesium transporter
MPRTLFYRIAPKGRLVAVKDLEAAVHAAGHSTAWIDLESPSREELGPIGEAFGIHPLTLEDCLDASQIPKMESFPSYTFVLVNGFRLGDGTIEVDEFDFILGRSFLISVHPPAPFLDALLQRYTAEGAQPPRSPDLLFHAMLDCVVDRKLQALEVVQEALEKAEDDILEDPKRFDLSRLMDLRREVLTIRKSLFHEREILARLTRRDATFVQEKALVLFRDVQDHLQSYHEEAENARETLSSLMEVYLSTMNNEMARAANRTNRVVRRLTFITTVFMPLTLLASIGGMSEWSMMTGPENWRISYPVFLLLTCVVGLVSYRLLIWVDRRPQDGDES